MGAARGRRLYLAREEGISFEAADAEIRANGTRKIDAPVQRVLRKPVEAPPVGRRQLPKKTRIGVI